MININKIYQWSRTNLFSNWYNSLLSLIIVFAFIKFIPPLLNWLFLMLHLKEVQKPNVMETALVGYSLRYGLKNLFMVCIQRIKFGE